MARTQSTVPDVLVVLLFLVFFPLGVLLMWTSTNWNSDLKWAISGLLFPPLWLRFLWRVWWLPYATGLLLAFLTLHGVVDGGLDWSVGTIIVLIIALVLFLTWSAQRGKQRQDVSVTEDRSRAAEQALVECDEIVAELEDNHSLQMLPPASPEFTRYVRALDLRSQGRELLERASEPRDVALAEQRITGALGELRAVRRGLPAR